MDILDYDLQHPAHLEVDLIQLFANAIPGAVAADLLGGGMKNVIVGGAFSAVTTDWIFVGRTVTEKQKDELSKKVPFLGLGLGYGSGKLGGLTATQSLGIGVVAAYLAYEYQRYCQKKRRPDADTSTSTAMGRSVPHYQAVNANPLSAPVARGLVVPSFYD